MMTLCPVFLSMMGLTAARVLTSAPDTSRLTITQQPLPLSSAPASLTCSAASDSLPDIAWYRDGVLVPGIGFCKTLLYFIIILFWQKELTTQGLAKCPLASGKWCPPWRSDAAPGYTCTRVWPVPGTRCFPVQRLWSCLKMTGGIVTRPAPGRRSPSGSATWWSSRGIGWSWCVVTWSIQRADTWPGHVTTRWTLYDIN